MDGRIQSLWRHPVKGFTPESLEGAVLTAGACFPCDRMYAVEDGPSGFDPAAPKHISKQRFTVLAKIPAVAKVRTRFDEASGVLEASFEGAAPIRADLNKATGREAFAGWLAEVLGEAAGGPLQVLPAPAAHRFMDDEQGFISIINLASVRDLEARLGRAVDPRRFRANLYVEGWPAWVENQAEGGGLVLGEAAAEVVKPIVRCVATHVDPETAERDIEIVRGLFEAYGHRFCGIYANITRGGRVALGDAVRLDLGAAA
ncbi:MAG: MOSC domain-containing protein [Caulobacteraceae bacterium]|nr:MOSC domain-containing protein [Caulobacteraceae bacterium]